MIKINISNEKHFMEAMDFARKIGGESESSLYRGINTLVRFVANHPEMELYLYPDFVKHSFTFEVCKKEKVQTEYGECKRYVSKGINGGLILHGYGKSYSVELEPKKYPHWSVHT